MKFIEWLELKEEKDACYYKVKATAAVWPSAYASGRLVQCRKKGAKNWGKKTINEIFELEKKRGLRGWFDRNHGKGWIDCKTSKKGKLVPCGRKKTGKGAEREYPACRPTLSACNAQGKKRKKSSKRISWKKEKTGKFSEWLAERVNHQNVPQKGPTGVSCRKADKDFWLKVKK